jgi:hypothetical protein
MPFTAQQKKGYEGLEIRILADETDGSRVERAHPITGEKLLVRPETLEDPGFDYAKMQHDPWPPLGEIEFLKDPPRYTRISTRLVSRGVSEGWASLVDEEVVHRPGGPPGDLWAVTHTFRQASEVVLHAHDSDVRYRVIHNPDKYAVVDREQVSDEKGLAVPIIDPKKKVTEEIYAAGDTDINWYYDLELVD